MLPPFPELLLTAESTVKVSFADAGRHPDGIANCSMESLMN